MKIEKTASGLSMSVSCNLRDYPLICFISEAIPLSDIVGSFRPSRGARPTKQRHTFNPFKAKWGG
jgi:hypothetical protein